VVFNVPRLETGRGGGAWRAGAGRCGGGAAPIDDASLARARGWSVWLYRANRLHVLPVLVLPGCVASVGAGEGCQTRLEGCQRGPHREIMMRWFVVRLFTEKQ